MDNVFYEKNLYRILQGRLRLVLGGLVLYVYEPNAELIEESYDVYEESYKQAYFRGCYLKKDLIHILVENDLWNPFYEKESKRLADEIEDLKVNTYTSFYDKRKVRSLKIQIRNKEREMTDYIMKKHVLDHISCEGVASFSRLVWLISKTTKFKDGTDYDWSCYPISVVMDHYASEAIPQEAIRKIARTDPWRSMWFAGKKNINIFEKPVYQLTKDQLALCSYSGMYDNVMEHPESPDEKVIEDDDCLDGWFIVQRRKHKKDKKQQEIDDMITNPKIKNSQEVFVVARDQQAANEIYELNHPAARATVHNRRQAIESADGEQISFTKFHDVRQDIAIQSHQQTVSKIKGGK
tara:strand:+ start:2359 stop:3411 length:1053 start_codon:yes stop_codon:yes gene_type:complete